MRLLTATSTSMRTVRSPNPLPPPCTTPTATTTTAFKTKIAAAITMLTSVAVRHIAAVDTPALNATTTPTGNDTREIAQGSGGGGGGSGFDFTLLGVVTAAVIVMLVIIIWCCRCRSKRGSSDVRLHINLARMMGGASQRSSAASRRSTGHSVEWLKYLLRIVPLAQEMMRSIGFLLG